MGGYRNRLVGCIQPSQPCGTSNSRIEFRNSSIANWGSRITIPILFGRSRTNRSQSGDSLRTREVKTVPGGIISILTGFPQKAIVSPDKTLSKNDICRAIIEGELP